MDRSINQRLRKFLREKNISQEDLRVKLGLKARQQVSNWVNNSQDHIPEKHLIAIITLFPDLNANWLFHNIGNPFMDQVSLRQINRNNSGYCEECMDKQKEIISLNKTLEKREKEIKEILIEYGKLAGRLEQYEAQEKTAVKIFPKKRPD